MNRLKLSLLLKKPLPYKRYPYNIVYIIIFINILCFIASSFAPSLFQWLAINPYFFLQGRFWSIVTYMFMHANLSHLFFNMLGLFFFGIVVERLWGSNEFILLYGTIGVLSGIVSLLVYIGTGNFQVFLLGASGAIYGVLLIFACMFPHERIYVFGIFPIPAKILMIIFIGIQLLSFVSGRSNGVAYFTHLSGIGIAWIYLLVRHNINPYHRLFGR